MLVFFTILSLLEFLVRYLDLFDLFSVIYGFKWFWMWVLHNNIQLIWWCSSGCNSWSGFTFPTIDMTFLMMLYVMLLSALMILISSLSGDEHLICCTSELQSDLRDTADRSRKWLVDFNNLSLFLLISLVALVLLMWKCMDLLLRNNLCLRCWDCLSLINWIGVLTLSSWLKLPPRKLEPWFNL